MKEMMNLADLPINKGNNCFYEIYNEDTGKVDGGWQQGGQWNSVYDQTCAAARSASTLSTRSHGRWISVLPKWIRLGRLRGI